MADHYTIPGMEQADGAKAAELLQQRLSAMIDLQLTLKHVHWNVVGRNFIGVHEMLDPQHAAVSMMVDEIAERIAALGYEPMGTPGFVAKNRTWEDYSMNRGTTMEHLGAMDLVYQGLIADHRRVMEELDDIDMVSQDLLIGQLGQMEKFHWFIRAHLEDDKGHLSTDGATSLRAAASAAQSTDNQAGSVAN